MTIFGPDGSYHQFGGRFGQATPWRWLRLSDADWNAVDFVLWRSSIGTRQDWTFARMRDEALRRRKAFTAYHFVYPTDRYSAAGQAEACIAALGRKDIPVMMDWEADGGLRPTWGDVLGVASELRKRGVRVPLVYTGHWYWSGIGRPHLAGHGLDLVLSRYGSNADGTAAARYAAQGGDGSTTWGWNLGGLTPTFWQFGSRVRWDGVYMDMNAFRGTADQLHRWFWVPSPPPPPTPPPAPTPPKGRLTMTYDDGIWLAAKSSTSGAFWLSDGQTRTWCDGGKWSNLRIAAGVVDASTERLVYEWDHVTRVGDWWVDTLLGKPNGRRIEGP
ncbi:MAG: GH25 family lysozyme [Acidimicrobiales bacterium]